MARGVPRRRRDGRGRIGRETGAIYDYGYLTVDGVARGTLDESTGTLGGYAIGGVTDWVEMTVTGPGTLTFWWKASSEKTARGQIRDGAAFFADGVQVGAMIGGTDLDWAQVSYEVATFGSHTFRWTYGKSEADTASIGEDCAWLGDVTWTPSGASGVAVWLAERNLTAKARAANGRTAAEYYALGLDPALATNDFRIVSIEIVDGKPKVEWEPKTNRWTGAEIQVVLKGAASLDGEWQTVTEENKGGFRFFKVVVELP